MKRFYTDVTVAERDGGWRVLLDGRPVKTQAGAPQVLPTRALADLLASEWAAQGEELDPAAFLARDLADLAIDQIAPEPAAAAARLVPYAETDTLCYRADPDEPLYRRQQAEWEPLLQQIEQALGVQLTRVSGVIHRPQRPEAIAALAARVQALDPFQLAALTTLASLAASLTLGLAALDPGADLERLWSAAELEETWQIEQWGSDHEAEVRRQRRHAAFLAAARFAHASSQSRFAGEPPE